jgi:hypothetical protein
MAFLIGDSSTTPVVQIPATKPIKPTTGREDIVEENGEKIRVVYTKAPLSEKKKAHLLNMNLKRKAGAEKTRNAKQTIKDLELEVERLKGAGRDTIAVISPVAKPTVDIHYSNIDAEIEQRVNELVARQKAEQNLITKNEQDVARLVEERVNQALATNTTSVRANFPIEKKPKPVKFVEDDPTLIAPVVMVRSRFDPIPRPAGRNIG